MRGTEGGRKSAEISILLPSISPKFENVLNFDLTGRYVDMRLDRGNCGLGNDSISVNIHRPSRILVPVKVLHFSQGGSNTFLTQA